jgi:transcriptional regulator with XRE-family HTH domain
MAESFVDKLLSTKQGRKLYNREELILEVTEAIYKAMQEKNVSKSELAEIAGVTKGNITQLLSGDHNMRLTTIADILFALDCKLVVNVTPIDIKGFEESLVATKREQWAPVIPEQPQRRHQLEEKSSELLQAA